MNNILIVEDNNMFASLLKKKIKAELKFDSLVLPNYAETEKLLNETKSEFFVAILDLVLPDAPNGEIIDLVKSKDIPCIILTSQQVDDIQEMVWSKMVVDYILKGSSYNIEYTISLIRRVYRNNAIKVMVVDDSMVSRKHICDLLKVHQYQVFEVSDGNEALQILKDEPNIKLVITDFNMPTMDGSYLTRKIRRMYSKDELAIIGMSVWGSNTLSAQFIKYGANDFINKPFNHEEFYCRITQNIEMLEGIEALKESLNVDYLTRLSNRRMFFDAGRKIHALAKRGDLSLAVAMIDIDFFKRINDTYGHASGDEILRQFGEILKKRFRSSDIVARFGGEEFCILMSNIDRNYTYKIFDEIRKRIEDFNFEVGKQVLKITISIGVCNTVLSTLEEMINTADEMLYEAKNTGRNKVIMKE